MFSFGEGSFPSPPFSGARSPSPSSHYICLFAPRPRRRERGGVCVRVERKVCPKRKGGVSVAWHTMRHWEGGGRVESIYRRELVVVVHERASLCHRGTDTAAGHHDRVGNNAGDSWGRGHGRSGEMRESSITHHRSHDHNKERLGSEMVYDDRASPATADNESMSRPAASLGRPKPSPWS